MKNKAILPISVSCKTVELTGEVNNADSIKRAFFDTNSATNTEVFCDSGNFGGFFDLNTKLSDSVDWAVFLAFLATFGGLAFVRVDKSNTGFGIHWERIGLKLLKVWEMIIIPVGTAINRCRGE